MPTADSFDAQEELLAFYERHYDELVDACLEASSRSYRLSPLNTLPLEERREWVAVGFREVMRGMAGEQPERVGRIYYPHVSELDDAPVFGMADIVDSCECALLPDEGILPLLWADYRDDPDKLYALVTEFRRRQNNMTRVRMRQDMDDVSRYIASVRAASDAERRRQIEGEVYRRFYLALLKLREKTNDLYDLACGDAEPERLRSEITQLKMIETDIVSEVLRINPEAGADELAPRSGAAKKPSFVQACLKQGITPREREVVELVAQGLTNAEVSERLSLADSTVKNYLSSILAKLGKTNRAQIVAFAAQNGYFDGQ